MIQEKLIDSLKKLPSTQGKVDSPLGPRVEKQDERPRSALLDRKNSSSTALSSTSSAENSPSRARAASMEVKKTSSMPNSPSLSSNNSKTRSVCGGRYLIGECVGRGNFGRVYNALDKNTGQFVAVKEIGCSNFNKV